MSYPDRPTAPINQQTDQLKGPFQCTSEGE